MTHADYALLLVLGGMWGSSFAVIRYGLLAGIPPLLFAGARVALGAVGVAILAIAARERFPDGRSLAISAVLGGVFLIGGYFAFLYIGEETVPAGLSSIIVATNPLWSAGFALLILPTERLGRYGAAGLAAGFLGVLLIFLPNIIGVSGISIYGLVVVLISPFLWALGTVTLRRLASGPQGYWGISTQLTAGALVLFASSAALEPRVSFPWAIPVWYALLYLVLIPTCVGYAIYFYLHHTVGPTQANLVSYVSPVSGLLLGAALLSEVPSPWSMGGLVLIALGLFLVGRDKRGTKETSHGNTDSKVS